jgi:hypothetical protein
MLDKFILDKAALISYSQDELNSIASTSNHLREIIKNQTLLNDLSTRQIFELTQNLLTNKI